MRFEYMNEAQVMQFLKSLLDPEMYGHAVTAEVRDRARVLLGKEPVETKHLLRPVPGKDVNIDEFGNYY